MDDLKKSLTESTTTTFVPSWAPYKLKLSEVPRVPQRFATQVHMSNPNEEAVGRTRAA